jgi:hypothetical protein
MKKGRKKEKRQGGKRTKVKEKIEDSRIQISTGNDAEESNKGQYENS